MSLTYKEQLQHPLWQRKRLEVLGRAKWRCERCSQGDKQLHAHHKIYLKGRMAWEYEEDLLECLCDPCHKDAHDEADSLALAIARRPTVMLPYI